MPRTYHDEQALAFAQAETFRISAQTLETPYPQWDFESLIYVDTTGPEWGPGVLTYTSDVSGRAEFLSTYAKDMPLADVPQSMEMRQFELAGIGYQYNIGEINTTMTVNGARLDDRRARAARIAYQRFMWDTTLVGQAEKGLSGLINQPNVTTVPAAATGTGTGVAQRYWGNKTTEQILADLNSALVGISSATHGSILANTILLPNEALQHISGIVIPDTGGRTLYSWFLEHNAYSMQTGQTLTIRGVRDLRSAATDTTSPSSAGKGRMVAYYDDPSVVRLLLPMPHRFLPVYQDGWANFVVPGIFRTGGVEMLMPQAVRYVDGICNDSDTGL